MNRDRMKPGMTVLAKIAIAAWLLGFPGTAWAANRVALSSSVYVEKELVDSRGRRSIVLEPPGAVAAGDRLVFLLRYRTMDAAGTSDLVVTNPMPETVSYQGSPDARAIVSVDGGRRWGALPALRVRERDGSLRWARPEDVTHVRWTLRRGAPAGSAGKLMFRGIAR